MSKIRTIKENTAVEKVKLWTRFNANAKMIQRLQAENKTIESDLAQLEKRPYNYFLVKQKLKADVQQAQVWAKELTDSWQKKYNLGSLKAEFNKVPL